MALAPQFVGTMQAVAGLVSLLFLKVGFSNRGTQAGRSFTIFAFSVFLWTAGLAVGNFTGEYTLSMWAYRVSLLGSSLGAVGWLLLAADVTDRITLTRPMVAGLAGWVVLINIGFWTNPAHGLMFGPGTAMDGMVLVPEYALGYWVHGIGSYTFVALGVGLLATDAVASRGLQRKQSFLLALASVPIVVANLVTLSDTVIPPYDVSPFGFLLSAFVFSLVLFEGRFLDLAPVARRTAIERMHDAVVTLDEQYRVVDCNSTARQLFDIGDDWVGEPAADLLAPLFPAVRSDLERTEEVETELTATLDGDRRSFSVSIAPVGDPDHPGRVLVLHDITARERRERELERKNEFLDEFASVVSHDIATPLGIVENKARLIEMTGDTSHAADIYDATAQVQDLVDELQDLARQGERVGDTTTVEFERVVRAAWRSVDSPDATLTVASSETVEADPDRLRQLLENLLRNAVEHARTGRSPTEGYKDEESTGSRSPTGGGDPPESPSLSANAAAGSTASHSPSGETPQTAGAETGSVTVEAGVLPDGFYVADDGPGIPESAVDSVFQRGYTTGDDNTGLGLAIVRRIVDGHGWVIEVSDSENGGARFDVTGVTVTDGPS